MFTTRITLTIIGAVLLALGVDGCGQAEDDTCSPTPDGYYQASPTTPGYTFVNGLPVAFVGWSCQSDGACPTTYVCDNGDQTETLTVGLVADGVVELTIDGVTQTLAVAK